jgi:hypothetical protein
MHSWHDQTVLVKCLDNGKVVESDVISYVEVKFLTVALKTVRVNLQYNSKQKCYIGSTAGLEFQSAGPSFNGVSR